MKDQYNLEELKRQGKHIGRCLHSSEIEHNLITMLEELLDRVPTNAEVALSGHCLYTPTATYYLWNDVCLFWFDTK